GRSALRWRLFERRKARGFRAAVSELVLHVPGFFDDGPGSPTAAFQRAHYLGAIHSWLGRGRGTSPCSFARSRRAVATSGVILRTPCSHRLTAVTVTPSS